jgi:hypothetical protein
VLGAPNENPPVGLGASDLGVDAGVVADPKENPVAGAAVVAVDVGAADVEVVLPNENDGADAFEADMDTTLVAAGVLFEARLPNGEPAPNPGLFNNELCELWFNPLTSDTARRKGDDCIELLADIPKADIG